MSDTLKFSEQLHKKITTASSIVAFTGAGISAESGVPTFRGDGGLWKKFKPEELANIDAFMRNPDLVWEWYKYRKKIISTIQPNPGHYAIAELERYIPNLTVITQNVDNLHRRAGSTTVYELHGNIERNFCIGCGTEFTDQELGPFTKTPNCRCGGYIRPGVVWFGEMLPEDQWSASEYAAKTSDIFLVIGTSAIVYPAASLPLIAKRAGAYVVEINISQTEFSQYADEVLPGKSGEILPHLVSECFHSH